MYIHVYTTCTTHILYVNRLVYLRTFFNAKRTALVPLNKQNGSDYYTAGFSLKKVDMKN